MHNQGEIPSNAIDFWALYLNAIDHIQKEAKANKRLQIYFFGCNQCVSCLMNIIYFIMI